MESIRVAVRIRPDENSFGESCLEVNESNTSLKISKMQDGSNRSEVSDYDFDNIYGPATSQESIFSDVRNLIDESLKGFNVTVFAFGMTGSGKTFTIAGNPQNPGIVPRTVHHIFTDLQQKSNKSEDTSELPDGDEILGLKLHEHPKKGMQISGSSTLRTPVTSANQALRLISQGNKLRSISSTNLNERSSRSHTVISFEIVSQDDNSITTSAKIGKINLVDLAGSERVKQSGAEGQSLEEAKQINKALSVLGDVLNSLSKHHKGLMSSKLISNINSKNILSAPHVPYRNSKLTMLLKDSLGGNAKTMMIATIRSSSIFYQQSIISLKYASRAKYIKCNPIQNITNNNDTNNDNSSNIMQETLLQVNRLKKQLHNRTEESDVLKTRLFELEKLRKISEIKGIEFSEESKRELEKEKKYKEKINNLQKDNIKEKKELEDYLRCIIHNHEGTLAEKEKVYVHLENQLAHHILLNKNLNNENKVVFVLKEKIEITNNQLIINLNEKENLIEQLKTRNNLLLNELNDYKIAQYSIIENNKKENDILNETINKLSISRNKYKKLSEEYKIDFDKTINDLPQYKHKTDEKNKNKNQYGTDSVISELKESLKACSEKLQENLLIIQRLENEKNEEIKNVDKYRNENNLLMENVVYIDSEWRKEIFEASEDKNLLEEKFRKLQNISQMDEIDKNRFKKEIKELSVELKDSLKRENDFKSNYNEIVIKIEALQSKIFKLQENEKENSEKNQIIVLENLHLQEKNLKSIEFSDNKSLYYENEKNSYEKKLVEIRKENEKLLNEKNENQMNSNKKNFSLENEIVTLKMMMTEKEIASDEKINNSEMIIEKLKKEFLDNLSCSQKNFLNSFQTEKQELEKYHVDVEANLSTDIDKLNFQFIELNNNNKIKTAALKSIIDKLNNDIIIIHNNNSSEKNNFEIIIENLNEKIAFYKINHEKIESEKNEYNSIILSLSEEIKKLKECSLNVIDRKLSEDKEEKMRTQYEEAISVLTKKEMKANNEFTFQNEKCQILENSLQNQKTETEKEKLIAKEIEKSDEEKKRLREEKIKNEELKVKEKEIMTNKIIEEKEKENDLLKSRLSIMILQEKNMFSSLKGRLSDLDEARSKLLKLQQSQTFNEKNSSQKFLLSEQQEAHLILEEKLVNIQKRNISMEGELKEIKYINKELKLELEKKTIQLSSEQKKSQSHSIDMDRILKTAAEDLQHTVSLVRERVEKGQERRYSELSCSLSKDHNIENSFSSHSPDRRSNHTYSRSNSLYSSDTLDSINTNSDQLLSFNDFMNVKHQIDKESKQFVSNN